MGMTVLLGLAGACGGESEDPVVTTEGHIEVALNTGGASMPGTVDVSIDGVALGVVAMGSRRLFRSYALGEHEVALEIPENCTVTGAHPRTVTVESGATILTEATTFELTCS